MKTRDWIFAIIGIAMICATILAYHDMDVSADVSAVKKACNSMPDRFWFDNQCMPVGAAGGTLMEVPQ